MLTLFFIISLTLFFFSTSKFPFFKRNNEIINTTYIFGHKNPDTDSIVSAIVMANLEKELGNPNYIQACRLGNINSETRYVLKYWNQEIPTLITESSPATEVILVDHNSYLQSSNDLKQSNVVKIIDHHALGGLETVNPINVILKPVGCASTIIYELYNQNNVTINSKMAGLMLSAILSDTILLKNSITTQEDIDAVKRLSNLSDVNYQQYGYDMLLAGTNVSSMSESEVLNMDSKQYNVNNYLIQLSWLNAVDIKAVTNRKSKFVEEMQKQINNQNIDLFVLCILDIMNMDSTAIVSGDLSKAVEEAFNVKVEDNEVFLKGVSVRKKDLYPPIATVINTYEPKSNSGTLFLKMNLLLIVVLSLVLY